MTLDKDPVATKLKSLQTIKNPYLNQVVYMLPIAISILLLIDWLIPSISIGFAKDTIRLSSTFGYIIELFLANKLFAQLPVSLKIIWERGLLNSKNSSSPAEERFLNFLEQLEKALNNKASLVLGVVFTVTALITTFSFRVWIREGWVPKPEPFIFFQLGIAYLFGLIAWRVGVIAFFVNKLGWQFELKIQSKHRDKCGGLKPLGDLCLSNAYIILVPVILLSIWVAVTSQPAFAFYTLWSDILRQWLIVLIIISIFTFFLPLYQIHKQMEREYSRIQSELDELSSKSEGILRELRTKGDNIGLDDGNEYLKRLEFFNKIYESSCKTPKWPFDISIIFKFSAAQVVPILSLFGISERIINIIKAFEPMLPK